MDDFGDFAATTNDDPTADFLAREQAILGADAALFGNPLSESVQSQPGPSTGIEQVSDLDAFESSFEPPASVADGFLNQAAFVGQQGFVDAPVDLMQTTVNPVFGTDLPFVEPTAQVTEQPKSQALLYWFT
jgi:hypothetical protein